MKSNIRILCGILALYLSAGCGQTKPIQQITESPAIPKVTTLQHDAGTQEMQISNPVQTGNADVVFVRAQQGPDDLWTFHVTVSHPDTGWESYADGWDVVLPDGTVAKPDPSSPFTRLLLHPHVGEQPFTRSQGGIRIPDSISAVTVRAHDLPDGFGGKEIRVDLIADEGPEFEVTK